MYVCVCVWVLVACVVCVLGNVPGLCGFKLPDFVPSSGSGSGSRSGNGHQTEARELFNSNKYWKLNFLWCFLVGLLRFCGVLISNNLASSVSTPQSRPACVCVCVCWAYTNTVTHTYICTYITYSKACATSRRTRKNTICSYINSWGALGPLEAVI